MADDEPGEVGGKKIRLSDDNSEGVEWTMGELMEMEAKAKEAREANPDSAVVDTHGEAFIYPDRGLSQESDTWYEDDNDEERLANLRTRANIGFLNETTESAGTSAEVEQSESDESGDESASGLENPLSANLKQIYDIHKESINAEILSEFGRSPTIEEFWRYYMNQYVEPFGWRGTWEESDFSTGAWPAPRVVNAVVQAIEFFPESMFVRVVVMNEEMSEPDNHMPAGVDVLQNPTIMVPLWEIVPFEAVDGYLINLQTFKEAVENLRVYKLSLSLPFHKEVSCEEWFVYRKARVLDLLHDLEYPGALSTKTRNEIVSLLCSVRLIEKELDELEFQVQHTEPEEEENPDPRSYQIFRDELDRQAYLQIKLEALGNRLKYLSDPCLRAVIEVQEMKKSTKEASGIELHDLVVVISDDELNFSIIDRIKCVAGIWLKKKTGSVDVDQIKFKIVTSLDAALKICNTGSIVLVGPGTHYIAGMGRLEGGGYLIGVPSDEKGVTIESSGTGDVWFLVNQGTLYLRDIEFKIKNSFSEKSMRQAVKLLSGSLDVLNCSFTNVGGVSFGNQKVWIDQDFFIDGIEAKEGSLLKLSCCQLVGFHVAVRLHDHVRVELEGSGIKNSHYAFEIIGQDLQAQLTNVKIEKVSNFLKTDIEDPSTSDGSFFGSEFVQESECSNIIQISSLTLPKRKPEGAESDVALSTPV